MFESLVPVISHQNQVLVLKISSHHGDFPQSSQVSIPGAMCGRAYPYCHLPIAQNKRIKPLFLCVLTNISFHGTYE